MSGHDAGTAPRVVSGAIDIHTHILPPKWPDLRERYGYGGFVRMEQMPDPSGRGGCCRARMFVDDRHFRDVESNVWDPIRRIAECEAAQVGTQVLSTVPVMFSYWAKAGDALDLSKLLNDHLGEVVREHRGGGTDEKRSKHEGHEGHEGRGEEGQEGHRRDADASGRAGHFEGLGTIPMQAPELAIRELERCVNELGLRGVQIGSHIDAADGVRNLDDPRVVAVLEAAAELGAAVFVHPWDMMGKERMPKYWLPWLVGMPAESALAICSVIFGGVLERLPKLRIGFAHGGGAFPFTIGRIEHGWRERPDLCAVDNPTNPRDSVRRIYYDSLVHDPAALRYLIALVGAERIALGSDYPFPLGELCAGSLIRSMPDLDDATRERLLRGTALEFLGMAGE